MPLDGVPSAMLANDATNEVFLVCDTPVALGATAEESTDFWFVIPPMTFSKGFTISVIQASGGVFEKSTSKSITIERNKLTKMSPIPIEGPLQPNNIIYYTSNDGKVVNPSNNKLGSAVLLSNEYVDGIGVMTFDQDVTRIDGYAFENRGYNTLTSIIIPNSVTSIGACAFRYCDFRGLHLRFSDNLTLIDDEAFLSTGLSVGHVHQFR